MFRIDPTGPVQLYQTYAIHSPLSTHTRPATCAEVSCAAHLRGWQTRVPRNSEQALYITSGASGRRYREVTGLDESDQTFWFEAGQRCFASDSHRVSLDRPATFLRRPGDHRGDPGGRRVTFAKAEDWRDDFGENQERILEIKRRG